MPEIDFSTAEWIRRGPRPGSTFVSLRTLRFGGCFISRREVAQRSGLSMRELARIEARRDSRLSALGRYAEALGGELQVSVKIGRHTFPIAFE